MATDKPLGRSGRSISSREYIRTAEDLAVARERQRLVRQMLDVQDFYLVDLNEVPAVQIGGGDLALDVGEDGDAGGRHGRDGKGRDKKSR